MAQLQFIESAYQRMQVHLESVYPNEGVGFLYGLETKNEREIIDILPVLNAKEGDQKRRFEIHPKSYLEAEEKATALGLSLIGVYHSHPEHPAIPSEHDLKAAVPYFSYVIVSVQRGKSTEITSWQLNEKGQFEEEKITEELIKQTLV